MVDTDLVERAGSGGPVPFVEQPGSDLGDHDEMADGLVDCGCLCSL